MMDWFCQLWADGDTSTSSAFSAVAAILALVTTIANGVISYLTTRDKLRFDAEMQGIRSGLLTAQEHLEECEKHNAELNERIQALSDRTTRAEIMTAKLEGELSALRVKSQARKSSGSHPNPGDLPS